VGAGGGIDPVVREHLGDVLGSLGLEDEAALSYRRALGLSPEDPERLQRKLDQLDRRIEK
jgi:hypothetical protein